MVIFILMNMGFIGIYGIWSPFFIYSEMDIYEL